MFPNWSAIVKKDRREPVAKETRSDFRPCPTAANGSGRQEDDEVGTVERLVAQPRIGAAQNVFADDIQPVTHSAAALTAIVARGGRRAGNVTVPPAAAPCCGGCSVRSHPSALPAGRTIAVEGGRRARDSSSELDPDVHDWLLWALDHNTEAVEAYERLGPGNLTIARR
jgi:hypothetical protein